MTDMLEREQGWQPIETLPVDGHSALLWLGDFHVRSNLNIRIGYRTQAGFFGTGGADRKLEHVTHWQPLPAPPLPASAPSTTDATSRSGQHDAPGILES